MCFDGIFPNTHIFHCSLLINLPFVYISALHLVENRHDHIKGRSLTRIFIHANPDELREMWRNSWWNVHA